MPRISRTAVLVVVVLALVILPFVFFGDRLEAWAHALLLDRRPVGWWPPVLLAALLAGDVVLPVPSSVLSTAAGVWWGPWLGALVSTIGMMLGSWLGYAIGRQAKGLQRWMGASEIARLERLFARHGEWIVVTLRPVPVLAEASAVFAGFSRMDAGRYTVLSLVANACVSLFYAVVGAWIGRSTSPAGAAVLLLALAVLAFVLMAARQRRGPSPAR